LVADDCQDHVYLLSKLLRFWGHRPLAAHDGATALGIALGQRPDVAVLDLRLPGGLDGCEVARRLRERTETEGVLLVALTGCDREDDHRSCLLAGFDHFLLKPADPEEIREVLTSYAGGWPFHRNEKSPAVAPSASSHHRRNSRRDSTLFPSEDLPVTEKVGPVGIRLIRSTEGRYNRSGNGSR
jgi:CheY-like chemotaxis protein